MVYLAVRKRSPSRHGPAGLRVTRVWLKLNTEKCVDRIGLLDNTLISGIFGETVAECEIHLKKIKVKSLFVKKPISFLKFAGSLNPYNCCRK